MKQIIKLTLLTDIGSCLIMFLIITYSDNFTMGLYASIITFGLILSPTLFAVFIFKLLQKKTTLKTIKATLLLQIFVLLLIFMSTLFLWAIIDVWLFKTVNWTNIQQDFNSQFLGFVPITFIQAISIPILDHLISKQKITQHNKKAT